MIRGDIRRLGAGFAELRELAGFAEVQQMSPDLGAAGLGVGLSQRVRLEQRLEMRGVRQIIGGATDLHVQLDQQIFIHRRAFDDASEERTGRLGIFNMRRDISFAGSIQKHEHVAERIFHDRAIAAQTGAGRFRNWSLSNSRRS